MTTGVLIELPYLPPISWFTLVWYHQDICLESCENYQKGSWRNRCHIAGPNGMQRLSIPLEKGKHQQTSISKVLISPDNLWAVQHWRSIQTAYGNAPYFDHYGPSLQKYFESPPPTLFDFNLNLLYWVLDLLRYKGKIELSQVYQPPGNERDFRNCLRPNDQQMPEWFNAYPYPQVFAGKHMFIPNLSILDLIMCSGRQTSAVLEMSFRNIQKTYQK